MGFMENKCFCKCEDFCKDQVQRRFFQKKSIVFQITYYNLENRLRSKPPVLIDQSLLTLTTTRDIAVEVVPNLINRAKNEAAMRRVSTGEVRKRHVKRKD